MSAELTSLRNDPFALLQALEAQVRAARLDATAGQAQAWTGLGFRLGTTWFVAPRDDVREVITPPATTRVPNARSWVRGLANVRGELLAIVDLAGVLGLADSGAQRAQRVLVLNSKRVPAGFLVDEVAGYRQFTPGEQRSEIAEQGQSYAPYLLGAFVREGQPWLAFSLHKLVLDESFRSAAL